jgi:HNH endonuclease
MRADTTFRLTVVWMGPIKYLVNLVSKFIGSVPTTPSGTSPLDVIGPKRYRPVGQCIYCGSTQTPLTDEHVVPYALNGNWVLPKASCKDCSVITGRVEQEILREELWHLRTALNFQTRRPAERPATVRLRADDSEVEVPVSDLAVMSVILPHQ